MFAARYLVAAFLRVRRSCDSGPHRARQPRNMRWRHVLQPSFFRRTRTTLGRSIPFSGGISPLPSAGTTLRRGALSVAARSLCVGIGPGTGCRAAVDRGTRSTRGVELNPNRARSAAEFAASPSLTRRVGRHTNPTRQRGKLCSRPHTPLRCVRGSDNCHQRLKMNSLVLSSAHKIFS